MAELTEHNYASKGTAGTALGLGIAGTALSLLGDGNLLSGLFGKSTNNNVGVCNENTYMTRQELISHAEIASRDQRIAILESENFTNSKFVDFADRMQNKFSLIDAELRNIAVYQATNTAGINCMANQLNALQTAFAGLTKTVIPAENVCPNPMPQYNSWTAPAAPTT